MNWVVVNGFYINLDMVQAFIWVDGVIALTFVARNALEKIDDPDQTGFRQLCDKLGLPKVPKEV